MTSPISRSKPHRKPAELFIWGIFGVLSLLYLGFVYRYGLNLPLTDEWLDIAPFLSGEKPETLTNLWAQFHQHRIFATHALLLPVLHFTGSFRLAMFVNAIILIAAVGLLLKTIGRVRGRLVWTDAVIPLVLLNFGHYENFLWAFQVQFIWSVAVVLVLTSFILDAPHQKALTATTTILTGCLLLTLPLYGASGLLFLPFLCAWYMGTRWFSNPKSADAGGAAEAILPSAAAAKANAARNRTISLVFLCLVGVLIGLYGYHYSTVVETSQGHIAAAAAASATDPAAVPVKPSPLKILHAAAYFYDMGFGIVAKPGFRASLRFVSAALTFLLPALYVLMGLVLLKAAFSFKKTPAQALCAMGLLGVLLGVTGEALAIGYTAVKGAGIGQPFDAGIQDRYALLSAVGIVVLYVSASFFAPRAAVGRATVIALAAVGFFYAPFNLFFGNRIGAARANFGRAVTSDLASGTATPNLLISRYGESMFADYIGPDYLAREMDALRRVGFKPFDRLRAEPVLQTIPLAVHDEPEAPAVPLLPGVESKIVVAKKVDISRPLYGMRLTFQNAYPATDSITHGYRLYWKNKGDAYQISSSHPFSLQGTDREITMTVYPNGPVDEFCVQYLHGPEEKPDAKTGLRLQSAEGLEAADTK